MSFLLLKAYYIKLLTLGLGKVKLLNIGSRNNKKNSKL